MAALQTPILSQRLFSKCSNIWLFFYFTELVERFLSSFSLNIFSSLCLHSQEPLFTEKLNKNILRGFCQFPLHLNDPPVCCSFHLPVPRSEICIWGQQAISFHQVALILNALVGIHITLTIPIMIRALVVGFFGCTRPWLDPVPVTHCFRSRILLLKLASIFLEVFSISASNSSAVLNTCPLHHPASVSSFLQGPQSPWTFPPSGSPLGAA
jgi:hypothetical protein